MSRPRIHNWDRVNKRYRLLDPTREELLGVVEMVDDGHWQAWKYGLEPPYSRLLGTYRTKWLASQVLEDACHDSLAHETDARTE